MGFDAGHSPSCVVGQRLGGTVQVYAAFNEMGAGMRELLERKVLPWLHEFAPWALDAYGAAIVAIVDPNMTTADQSTITRAPVGEIEDLLGGRYVKGPVRWAPRREAVLRLLGARHEQGQPPLLIAPGEDTWVLVEALEGQWFYKVEPDGQINRTGPKKPNSPHADVGDAFAYLADWLLGSEPMHRRPSEIKVETAFSLDPPRQGAVVGVGLW